MGFNKGPNPPLINKHILCSSDGFVFIFLFLRWIFYFRVGFTKLQVAYPLRYWGQGQGHGLCNAPQMRCATSTGCSAVRYCTVQYGTAQHSTLHCAVKKRRNDFYELHFLPPCMHGAVHSERQDTHGTVSLRHRLASLQPAASGPGFAFLPSISCLLSVASP